MTVTAESTDDDDTGDDRSRPDVTDTSRRRILQGLSVAATASLAGCTISSDGITWGDIDSEESRGEGDDTTQPTETATDPPEEPAGEEEDDEIDLSEYEDGSFSGGTPETAHGTRDGIEITVAAGEVESVAERIRANTVVAVADQDLVANDNLDVVLDDADETDEPEIVANATLVEQDTQVINATLVPTNETSEEDDDE